MRYCTFCGVQISECSRFCQSCGTVIRTNAINSVGKTCPYCQFPIKPGEALEICTSCEVPHHKECWSQNGGKCTTFGCQGTVNNPQTTTAASSSMHGIATDASITNTNTIHNPATKRNKIFGGVIAACLLLLAVVAFNFTVPSKKAPTQGSPTSTTPLGSTHGTTATGQGSVNGQRTISIGYTPWTGYGPLFVAKEKGLFAKNGLNVKLISIESVGERKLAIINGRIDGMASSYEVAVSMMEEVPLRLVWFFDDSRGADGIISKTNINRVSDLKGRVVAYHRGSAAHIFLRAVLEKNGLTEHDISSVDMKASTAAAAFMEGKVDAAVTWEPHLTKATRFGGRLLISSKETPGLISDTLSFTEPYVKANPDIVRGVVRALAEATDYVLKNPDEASRIIAKGMMMKPEDVKADFPTIKFYNLSENKSFFGDSTPGSPAYRIGVQVAQFYIRYNVLLKMPDITRSLDRSFVDSI